MDQTYQPLLSIEHDNYLLLKRTLKKQREKITFKEKYELYTKSKAFLQQKHLQQPQAHTLLQSPLKQMNDIKESQTIYPIDESMRQITQLQQLQIDLQRTKFNHKRAKQQSQRKLTEFKALFEHSQHIESQIDKIQPIDQEVPPLNYPDLTLISEAIEVDDRQLPYSSYLNQLTKKSLEKYERINQIEQRLTQMQKQKQYLNSRKEDLCQLSIQQLIEKCHQIQTNIGKKNEKVEQLKEAKGKAYSIQALERRKQKKILSKMAYVENKQNRSIGDMKKAIRKILQLLLKTKNTQGQQKLISLLREEGLEEEFRC